MSGPDTVNRAPIQVVTGTATDVGLRRAINEDSYLAEGSVFLVADGMGGHEAGEIASATVVTAFRPLTTSRSITLDQLQAAFADAAGQVARLPEGGGAGAGTTLSGVVIAELDGNAYWLMFNLGDSRTYRLSGGVLAQISVDHSLVQELVERGELTPAQAATDAQRNIVTRAIGAGSESEPDYWYVPAEPADRILICSDGLTGELDDARIRLILSEEAAPQAAATRLVHEALLSGGRDNVTAVVVDALSVYGAHAEEHTMPADRGNTGAVDAPDWDDTIPRDELAALLAPDDLVPPSIPPEAEAKAVATPGEES
ncbi:PP2C family protein-serine/threonine phosphatase [Cryobacterium zhongshanensis]|uniref:Protein phosphatase 2C domain-containing protein n=1 Tax=Cryobacterium zhongshanensis TaxID=2928153 RepID=A0AA41UFP7_9MICO|nr:protein phosphatase 2C domain-containing protein [Cryobacterium zhongshanensis]MCI4658190.1 protein phosphatase 2C domain-containing protein [Cryobacterium zhongshanensis]